MSIVYLNGEFLPKDEAKISPDDRGFLLADGVYEVTPFYEGTPFCLERHLATAAAGSIWPAAKRRPSALPAPPWFSLIDKKRAYENR